MTTGIAIRHYTRAPALRPLLLDVYTEVYATAARTDVRLPGPLRRRPRPLDRTARLDLRHRLRQRPAHRLRLRSTLPPRSRWCGGELLTHVPAESITETGTRTYALSELMVREPWRRTGTARHLHDTLLTHRPEQRAKLLVYQDHPKVHALYQSWGSPVRHFDHALAGWCQAVRASSMVLWMRRA
ncbi:hypothetical protein [Streptomyces sp. NPDC094466]|uniref:hypothetical protein n=1 Tax=Streptomyces sp. NPDC094466 TaxID=3366065 RepID=UPI0037F1A9BE